MYAGTNAAAETRAQLEALERQRRVLVFADLVQSVRLMRAHEDAVIRRWLVFVACVQHEVLPRHGGRLVKSHGDAILVEFRAVNSAVEAAFELHDQMRLANPGEPDFAMQLRVGIHVADVVVEQLDIFGSGVNLAARLASLADADQIIISTEVRDQVSDCHDWHLVDLGLCFLKHFEQPVRAYRLGTGAAPLLPGPGSSDHRPALAVVPLVSRAGPGHALGDAIADDIIAAVSRQHSLRVISRMSTSGLRGKRTSPQQIGELLGATFLLCGSFIVFGEDVEVTVQLVETRGGVVLWTDRLVARVSDIFRGQDDLVPTIATHIGRHVLRSEVQRARALPITSLDDYTLYVAGVAMLNRLTPDHFSLARDLLEHLQYRHPRSAAPRAMLAKWHVMELAQGWADNRQRSGQLAQDHARRALDLEPDHALALAMQSAALGHVGGDLGLARELSEQAIEADPQEPHAWLTLGAVHSWLGEPALAEQLPLRAVSLSPIDPSRYLFDVFVAAGKLAIGSYDDAAVAARASIRLNAMHPPSHRLLTIALVLAGNMEQARQSAHRLLHVDPAFRVSDYARRYAGRGRPHAELRFQALRDAGIPD